MRFPGSGWTLDNDTCAVLGFKTTDDFDLIIVKRKGKEERLRLRVCARLAAVAPATGSRSSDCPPDCCSGRINSRLDKIEPVVIARIENFVGGLDYKGDGRSGKLILGLDLVDPSDQPRNVVPPEIATSLPDVKNPRVR